MTSLNPLLALKTLAQNVGRAPGGAECRVCNLNLRLVSTDYRY